MAKRFKSVTAGMGKAKFWYLWILIDLVPVITVGILNFTVFNDFARILSVTSCLIMTLGIAHVLSLFQRAAFLDPTLKNRLQKTEAKIALVLYLNMAGHVAIAGYVAILHGAEYKADLAIKYNEEAVIYNNGIAQQEAASQDRFAARVESINKSATEFEKSQRATLDSARKLYGETGQLKVGQIKAAGSASDIGVLSKYERRALKPVPLVEKTGDEFLKEWNWIFIVLAFFDLAVSMRGGYQFKHVYTEDEDGDGKPDWEQRAREKGISQKTINAAKPKGWFPSLSDIGNFFKKVPAKILKKYPPKVPAKAEAKVPAKSTRQAPFDAAKEGLLNYPDAGSKKLPAELPAKSTRQTAEKYPPKVPAKVEKKVPASEPEAKPEPARREGNRWIIHGMALPHIEGCRWEARPNFTADLWILGKARDSTGYADCIGKRDLLKFREMFEDERFAAIQARVAPKLEGKGVDLSDSG